MGSNIQWGAPPQQKKDPFVPIYRAVANQRLEFVILSQRITSVLVHWGEQRTAPCLGTKEACPGCAANKSKHWYAYLAVLSAHYQRIGVAEITQLATEQIEGWDLLNSNSLRGLVLTLARRGSDRRSPVVAAIDDRILPEGLLLPAAPDVPWVLARIWGYDLAKDPPPGALQEDDIPY